MRRFLPVAVGICASALALPGVSSPGTGSVLPGFRSPSGNIKCLYIPNAPVFVYCTIAKANYAKSLSAYCAQPRFGVDWAGFTLGRRTKGSVECAGGVLYDPVRQHPSYITLPYGQRWKRGVFTCWSRVNGVTCRNPAGHGLFVSREAWRSF